MNMFRVFFFFFFLSSCSYSGELEIIQVKMSNPMIKEECFLIRNYNKNIVSRSIVDNFICNKIKSVKNHQGSYIASFYKETSLVNAKSVKEDDDNLYTFGQHLITYRCTQLKVDTIVVSRSETFTSFFSKKNIVDNTFRCN